jgi:hypothetical protein
MQSRLAMSVSMQLAPSPERQLGSSKARASVFDPPTINDNDKQDKVCLQGNSPGLNVTSATCSWTFTGRGVEKRTNRVSRQATKTGKMIEQSFKAWGNGKEQ